MASPEKISAALVKLGLGKTEADVFVQLILLAGQGEMGTGYRVAKELGKDPTSVYKALEGLLKRGAVETVSGRGKRFRPVPVGELTARLKKEYEEGIAETEELVAGLGAPVQDEEVYRLMDRTQCLDRFLELLRGCRGTALLDIAPGLLGGLMEEIVGVAERGVVVVLKDYGWPMAEVPKELDNFLVVTEPNSRMILEIMPGEILHGVFDCATNITAYLPGGCGDEEGDSKEPAQAYWTANRFLAFQAHSGLAAEILHTELRDMLEKEVSVEDIRDRQEGLARWIHGGIDWEGFWRETGLGDADYLDRRREVLSEGEWWVPWVERG